MSGQKLQTRTAAAAAVTRRGGDRSSKRASVVIENIEEMRLRQGIHDDELRQTVLRLRVGDVVKLTFSTTKMTCAGETLLVRVTQIKGELFRGKLADRPALPALSSLRVGSSVVFKSEHIHSVPRGPIHDH
jgi:hypothetical protein